MTGPKLLTEIKPDDLRNGTFCSVCGQKIFSTAVGLRSNRGIVKLLLIWWRFNQSSRKFHDNGQAFTGDQRPCCCNSQCTIAGNFTTPVGAALADNAGKGGPAHWFSVLRQVDRRARGADEKGPFIAGGVPEQLVMIGQETNLPTGFIAEQVSGQCQSKIS